MRNEQMVWLAAQYHFPATYSCRLPLSSMSSAQGSPGPGPATVRLALIKVGCELFGRAYMQQALFPVLRAAPLRVRPPERVAISQQLQRIYKGRGGGRQTVQLVESIGYREVAQAQGLLTVYLHVPIETTNDFRETLKTIGYWGQTDSFATCVAVEETAPAENECALPWRTPVGDFFSCVMTEFRHTSLSWEEVVSGGDAGEQDPLWRELYVWPMLLAERRAAHKLLVRHPFTGSVPSEGRIQDEVQGDDY